MNPELHNKWDTQFVEGKCVQYFKRDANRPFALTVVQEQYRMGWPLSDRDFIIGISLRYESQKKRYVQLRKSCALDNVPEKKGCVRALVYCGWYIEDLGYQKSRFTLVAYLDLCGLVPARLFNYLITKRGDESHGALLKVLKAQQKLGFPAAVDTERVFETMAENSMSLNSLAANNQQLQQSSYSLLQQISKRGSHDNHMVSPSSPTASTSPSTGVAATLLQDKQRSNSSGSGDSSASSSPSTSSARNSLNIDLNISQ